jgi:HEAT repeat protein
VRLDVGIPTTRGSPLFSRNDWETSVIIQQLSRTVRVLLVTSACAIFWQYAGTAGAWQISGIGDETSWRERKLRELKSDNVDVRREAANALIRDDVDGTKLIDGLIQAMSDKDFSTRRSVIIALRVHGAGRSDVAVALRRALGDPDRRLASDIIYALTVVDPKIEDSLDALADAAMSDDRMVTPEAIKAMTKIGAPAVPRLVQMLTEPGWVVRGEAFAGLVRLGDVAKPAVAKIVEAATAPNGVNTNLFCPKLVTWSGDAVPELIKIVRENPKSRGDLAAACLGVMGESAVSAVPALLEVAQDARASGSTRSGCIRALPSIAPSNDDVLRCLTKLAEQGRHEYVRVAARLALKHLKEREERLHRERARRSARNQAGPERRESDNAQHPSELLGTVVLEGVGVEGVRVALSWRRDGENGELDQRMATTDALGTFRFPEVPNGLYHLVAFHPGHEPSIASVDTNRARRQQITLRPTEPAVFSVADGENAVLPDVSVRIDRYRSAPMPPVELRTDEAGRFLFPVGRGFVGGEAVHPGYMRTRFRLSRDANRSQVVMLKPYRVAGEVTDANTGAPIPEFTVTQGVRMGQAPAMIGSKPLGTFTNGAYEIRVEESANRSAAFDRLALAFDAPGYQQGLSPRYSERSGDLVFDIELVPQSGTEGRVIDENSKPVADGDVILVATRPLGSISLFNGRPSAIVDRLPRFRTESDGRFTLSRQTERFALLVVEDRGFAFVTDTVFAEQPVVQLTPWARLSGVVRSGNEVVAGAQVDIRIGSADSGVGVVSEGGLLFNSTWRPSFHYSVETDENGRFSVDRVRPGRVHVGLPVKIADDAIVVVEKKILDMAPGEAYDVSIGGGGRRVVGRIDAPRRPARYGQGLDPCVSVFGGAVFNRTAAPRPSMRDAKSVRGLPKPYLPFGLHEDGAFVIDDVAPGKYRLVIELWCPDESGPPVYYVGHEVGPPDYFVDHEFAVPEGDLGIPLDLGELKTTQNRK